ncbi:hypothetical protein CAP35_13000 [Chitinophagaceae bacterium IBVUCB1]|nr:hypothetical protein CAP35_13000 [Chitinophagaceae bacterium IBVUCB1]
MARLIISLILACIVACNLRDKSPVFIYIKQNGINGKVKKISTTSYWYNTNPSKDSTPITIYSYTLADTDGKITSSYNSSMFLDRNETLTEYVYKQGLNTTARLINNDELRDSFVYIRYNDTTYKRYQFSVRKKVITELTITFLRKDGLPKEYKTIVYRDGRPKDTSYTFYKYSPDFNITTIISKKTSHNHEQTLTLRTISRDIKGNPLKEIVLNDVNDTTQINLYTYEYY